ncbi:MAG: sialate O-acetylesterase [Victivallales bacterium]
MMGKLALIISLCVATLYVVAQEKPMKVFVLSGQSNMYGMGDAEELPNDLNGEQSGVLSFESVPSGKAWIPLARSKIVYKAGGIGPELSFAKEIRAKINEPIGIIKYAKSGSNLAKNWNPDDPKSDYANLVRIVNAAQKSRNIEIVGMLWMQGESDAMDKEMANAYAANLSQFIQRARKDFNSPKMFFVAGRQTERTPFTDIVGRAQEKCNLPGYAFINCDKLSKKKDNTHYDMKGLVKMGCLFADAMLKLMGGKDNKINHAPKE